MRFFCLSLPRRARAIFQLPLFRVYIFSRFACLLSFFFFFLNLFSPFRAVLPSLFLRFVSPLEALVVAPTASINLFLHYYTLAGTSDLAIFCKKETREPGVSQLLFRREFTRGWPVFRLNGLRNIFSAFMESDIY